MGGLQVYNSRAESYQVATRLLRAIKPKRRNNFVWVESVGKQDDIQHLPETGDHVITDFHSALGETILSNVCEVRYLVRVSSPDTLEAALKKLVVPFSQAKSYQVKAAVLDRALSTFSPLIVGDHDTLIGFGREASMTEACIHLQDPSATRLAMQYFELLWNDRCTVVLRDSGGTNDQSIDLLRNGLVLRRAFAPVRSIEANSGGLT